MFPALRNDVENRFANIEEFFQVTANLRQQHAAVAKGLVFVQAYAVYEFTVNGVVSAAIESIMTHEHKMEELTPSLMALFLDPEFKSLQEGSRSNEWANRLKLLERAFSKESINLSSSTRPPNDGSHYRYTHLRLIFEVFGIRRLPVRRHRHRQRIDEVVAHRNSIAHGHETAEDIGRRYTRSEIRTAVRQMKSVCMLLIQVLDEYCADPARHRRR